MSESGSGPNQQRDDGNAETQLHSRPRARAFGLGLALIPANAWWVLQCETLRFSEYPTALSLLFNAVVILLGLLGLNALVRRAWPALALRRSELLLVYVMLTVASSIDGVNFLPILVCDLGFGFWNANESNGWARLFHRYVPDWAAVKDVEALRGLYEGHASFYAPEVLRAWLPPLLHWSVFILALLGLMLGLNLLLRRRWTEEERLTYPIIHLPLELTEPGAPRWRSPWLWWGLGLAAAVDVLNGLHVWYPVVPALPVKGHDLGPLFTSPPWNAIGWTPCHFYPFALGMGMLVPLDMLFSTWFFYLVWKAERVACRLTGWDATPGVPFVIEQAIAGCVALALFGLWMARGHLWGAWQRGRKGTPANGRGRKGMAFVLCAGVLAVFTIRLGMAPALVLPFFAIYYLIGLGITRMRAEFGAPTHDLFFSGPDAWLTHLLGSERLSGGTLTAFTYLYFTNRAYPHHPMPFQMESLKIAERARCPARAVVGAMLLASAAAIASGFWILLALGYEKGLATANINPGIPAAFGNEPFNRLANWLRNPQGPNVPLLSAMAGSFLFTLGLMGLRTRLLGFPFHPAGYVISASTTVNFLWLPLLIAWAVKWLVLRYGGRKWYDRLLPFCYGLILGEFVVGSVWSLVGIVRWVPVYGFWW